MIWLPTATGLGPTECYANNFPLFFLGHFLPYCICFAGSAWERRMSHVAVTTGSNGNTEFQTSDLKIVSRRQTRETLSVIDEKRI
jgi:hypothetical protein